MVKEGKLPDIFLDLDEELKREVVAELFNLKVYSKTITLIGGQSMTGKTVTCMHMANDCIRKGKTVLYFDTDSHPISKRPDPNLLKTFTTQNPDKYKKFFKYTTSFDPDLFMRYVDLHNPALVIIDSIYAPYLERYASSPKLRAKKIRHFLMNVREKLLKKNIAMIVTSQVGKESSGNGEEVMYNILGGEGLKHMSDTKWVIDFVKNGDSGRHGKLGHRIMFIDKQVQVQLVIGYGGKIEKAN